jgi:zeaxanthin glucosyltransferase
MEGSELTSKFEGRTPMANIEYFDNKMKTERVPSRRRAGRARMKIGFVSMPVTGHLNPMTALARKLQSRGNEVVFIGLPDAEPIVRAANLNFVPFCEQEYPVGSVAKGYAPLAKLHGLHVVEHSAREIHPGRCKSALEHLPEKLAETGVQALVIDTAHFFVELVPMRLGMPYVRIWNILHLDRSGSSPACVFGWPYETTPEALARNVDGLKKVGGLLAPVLAVAKSYAEKNGLQIDWNDPAATVSKLAVITQTPKEFDFPISNWPPQFHLCGSFSRRRRTRTSGFSVGKIDGGASDLRFLGNSGERHGAPLSCHP